MSYYKLTPAIPLRTTHWVNTNLDNDLNYNIMRLQQMYDVNQIDVKEVPYSEWGGPKPRVVEECGECYGCVTQRHACILEVA